MTVAAFMELALYDPDLGYYARAARRSGRAGDFITSVDVGALFGELLEVQIAEMAALVRPGLAGALDSSATGPPHFIDLVEAGAGDGRLSADILRAAKRRNPNLYSSLRVHLVEASAAARAAQRSTLDDVADRLAGSSPDLPEAFEGILVANELLDAMPTHQVVMRRQGLREIYVSRESEVGSRESEVGSRESEVGSHESHLQIVDDELRTIEGPPSTPELQRYLDRVGVTLEPGWRVEINLAAVEWMRDAARRLTRGFIILLDYGHDARELYSAAHSAGTLTSFVRHRSGGAEARSGTTPWLVEPGERDIIAHVDFTAIRAAAETEGLCPIAFLDQTYFLMGLLDGLSNPQSAIRNPQFKTLILPGGLGSTMKVLVLGKGVGVPALKGASFQVRVT